MGSRKRIVSGMRSTGPLHLGNFHGARTNRVGMQKKYDSDTPDEIATKVSRMITDSQRMIKSDPGNPGICNLFEFHKICSDQHTWESIVPRCR